MKLNRHKLFSICISIFFTFSISSAIADGWLNPPLTVSVVDGTNISSVEIGTAADGTSTAVWEENDLIKASSAAFGSEWNTPTTLSISTGSSPRIYVDPAGNATAIWIEGGILYAASMTPDHQWSRPSAISSSGVSQPLIQGDLTGNVVAIWQRGDAIESSTLPFGGTWPASPDVLSMSNSSSPALWASNNGYVVAAWTQVVSEINVIYALQKQIGSSWSTAVAISDLSENSVYPAVSIGAQNQAVAVWYTYDLVGSVYSNVYVKASTQDTRQNWSEPLNLSDLTNSNTENSTTQSSPGVIDPSKLVLQTAIDDQGNIIVVWTMSNDGSTFNVQSKRKSANLDWEPDLFLLWTPNPCIYSLDISSQSAGKVLITWMYLDEDLDQLVVQSLLCSYSAGNYYRNNLPLSVANDNYYPDGSVAAGMGVFYATAAWISTDGTKTSVQAIQGSKDLPLPPIKLNIEKVETTHAIFTDLTYILTWEASPSRNVIAYYVYRDDELVFQDYGQAMMFIDHNRTPEVEVTYKITTFTFGGLESDPAAISYP